MDNCTGCKWYWPETETEHGFCSKMVMVLYILLDADECPAYAEKEGP